MFRKMRRFKQELSKQKNSKENFCLTFPQKRNIITFKRVAD